MSQDPSPLTPLGELLRAEPGLFAQAEHEDGVISGVMCGVSGHEHPMAWRYLPDQDALEALTLVPPSPDEVEAMPSWRDPGWAISTHEAVAGENLTLWWHAATQHAMLASCIARHELRRDTVARCLRLHHEGLALCRQRLRQSWAEARPRDAIALNFMGSGSLSPFA